MSPRIRRRLIRLGAATAAVTSLLLVAAFVVSRSRSAHSVNVIAIESRAPSATTEADVAAELEWAEASGGELLLTAVDDQTAAPALDADLACQPGTDPISCGDLQQRESRQAQLIADRLASAPRPADVDLYALFAQISSYLGEDPAGTYGEINVYVNTLGDADIPQNLAKADLADGTTISTLAREAVSEGAFPGSGGCKGWQVHMIVPATAQPAHDRGLRELFTKLVVQCGGRMATWTPRWLAPSGAALALPVVPGVETPTPSEAQPTFRIPDTLFAVGSATISPAGERALTEVATDIFARYPGQSLTCLGSADGTGGSSPSALAVDQSLSKARATAVCSELIDQGMPQDLTQAKGLGQTTTEEDVSARSVSIVIGGVQIGNS